MDLGAYDGGGAVGPRFKALTPAMVAASTPVCGPPDPSLQVVRVAALVAGTTGKHAAGLKFYSSKTAWLRPPTKISRKVRCRLSDCRVGPSALWGEVGMREDGQSTVRRRHFLRPPFLEYFEVCTRRPEASIAAASRMVCAALTKNFRVPLNIPRNLKIRSLRWHAGYSVSWQSWP